jgi:hypothetical protein
LAVPLERAALVVVVVTVTVVVVIVVVAVVGRSAVSTECVPGITVGPKMLLDCCLAGLLTTAPMP